ncbi:hypothetical protein P8C59_007964 [Phyllachora maydis]|uniref:Uncharacterized protein n=1 Tax=Phyllachora maydis TaxID=1825666 RepID=A0AAD9I9T2_9PEZI|nr:hypothetical protein P8C59_007964 [Phyllachora maydis]
MLSTRQFYTISEASASMSPSPGDNPTLHEARSSGGLAGVFRGLTSGTSKLTKTPPEVVQQQVQQVSHPELPTFLSNRVSRNTTKPKD